MPQPEVLVDYYKSLVARTDGYDMEEQSENNDSAGTNTDGGSQSTGTDSVSVTEALPGTGIATREAG